MRLARHPLLHGLLTLFSALVLVLGNTQLHEVLHSHVYCNEHGVTEHLPDDDGPLDAAAEHGEVCVHPLVLSTTPPPAAPQPQPLFAERVPTTAEPQGLPGARAPPLRNAPKTSPPTPVQL